MVRKVEIIQRKESPLDDVLGFPATEPWRRTRWIFRILGLLAHPRKDIEEIPAEDVLRPTQSCDGTPPVHTGPSFLWLSQSRLNFFRGRRYNIFMPRKSPRPRSPKNERSKRAAKSSRPRKSKSLKRRQASKTSKSPRRRKQQSLRRRFRSSQGDDRAGSSSQGIDDRAGSSSQGIDDYFLPSPTREVPEVPSGWDGEAWNKWDQSVSNRSPGTRAAVQAAAQAAAANVANPGTPNHPVPSSHPNTSDQNSYPIVAKIDGVSIRDRDDSKCQTLHDTIHQQLSENEDDPIWLDIDYETMEDREFEEIRRRNLEIHAKRWDYPGEIYTLYEENDDIKFSVRGEVDKSLIDTLLGSESPGINPLKVFKDKNVVKREYFYEFKTTLVVYYKVLYLVVKVEMTIKPYNMGELYERQSSNVRRRASLFPP